MRRDLVLCSLILSTGLLTRGDAFARAFDGEIAGNLTREQCFNSGTPPHLEGDISTVAMIRKSGYPVEEHLVETEDGYLLTVHRIPGKLGAPPVFLQHGMLSSSFEWVLSGKDKAPAFFLSDYGYDVWIGNARGNTYSRCHTMYDTRDSEFWDFSWHEMGVYDLPAAIVYIAGVTNQKIFYIGHSMGTTLSYVMAIERPEVTSKVKVIFSLAPIAYIANSDSVFRHTVNFFLVMGELIKYYGNFGALPQENIVKSVSTYFCSLSYLNELCAELFFPLVGYNKAQFNYTLLPTILNHLPAGTSIKTLVHLGQIRSNDRFHKYDYGVARNLERYGVMEPPEYDASKIRVPVGLVWSENDPFSHPKDIDRFRRKLKNLIWDHKVEDTEFNHVDYLYAIDAQKYIYSKIISVMEDFR